jgi:ABC-type transport system involved in multi-copper enzyme maturation permease subunit
MIAVGIVANVIWILASTAIGLVVFKKREVKG